MASTSPPKDLPLEEALRLVEEKYGGSFPPDTPLETITAWLREQEAIEAKSKPPEGPKGSPKPPLPAKDVIIVRPGNLAYQRKKYGPPVLPLEGPDLYEVLNEVWDSLEDLIPINPKAVFNTNKILHSTVTFKTERHALLTRKHAPVRRQTAEPIVRAPPVVRRATSPPREAPEPLTPERRRELMAAAMKEKTAGAMKEKTAAVVRTPVRRKTTTTTTTS